MSTYRLFPSTTGPTTATAYSGPFLAGIGFKVTQPTLYLSGYYWWVASGGGQPTGAQKFAIWNDGGGVSNLQYVVPTGTVTSGALTAGQWNYVPLATPIPLTANQVYVAGTGFTGAFPSTNNQFGSGQPYAAGITNGPLFAYSDASGSAPSPISGLGQGLFSTAGTDPALYMPGGSSNSANFWMDVEITDTVPASPTYRLFPSMPAPYQYTGPAGGTYTLCVEFKLSQACRLQKLWMFSGPNITVLPSRCGIFSVSSQTEVAGTDNSSPTWLSAPSTPTSAGNGWCYVDYTAANITLPAGSYRAAIYANSPSTNWFGYTSAYWSAFGAANGPISAPINSNADAPGQGGSLAGAWGYPTNVSNSNNFWIDVEVTPMTMNAGGSFLTFF